MGKIGTILEQLILELTYTQIKDKFYSDVDDMALNMIVKADPKTKVVNNNIVKMGNYAKLLIRMFQNEELKIEDLPRATEYLEVVYRKRLPLTATVKNLEELYELVKDYIITDGETDINKILDSVEPNEYEELYDGDKWRIFTTKTEKASCKLGSGTEWCTAWGKHSTNQKHQGKDNYFSRHHKQAPLYILINKKDNSIKYQFHVPTNQFMDKHDRTINLDDFLTKNEEIFFYFNPEFKTGLDKVPTNELLKYTTRKFITRDAIDDVVAEIVKRDDGKEIISVFFEAEENEEFGKLNSMLSAEGSSDFVIEHIGENIEFKSLEDGDLETYDYLGGDTDIYIEDDDVQAALDYILDAMVNDGVRKKEIIDEFDTNGLDILGFLSFISNKKETSDLYQAMKNYFKYKDSYIFETDINQDLLEFISKHSSAWDGINEEISEGLWESRHSAESEAGSQLEEKALAHFSIYGNTIKRTTFLLFLIESDSYDMDSFKGFIDNRFGIIIEDYSIWDEMREISYGLEETDYSSMVNKFIQRIDAMFEWVSEEYYEEVDEFTDGVVHTSDDDKEWIKNIDKGELESLKIEAGHRIAWILNKYTGSDTPTMVDNYRELHIDQKKINFRNNTVYIIFKNLVTLDEFDGYVEIELLPKYINNGKKAGQFYSELDEILTGLGLDTNTNEYENALVTLNLDYKKVDVENKTIFITLTRKKDNKIIRGSVKIDSLPVHFRNYELFEYLLRYKKMI